MIKIQENYQRKPDWLKIKLKTGSNYSDMKELMKKYYENKNVLITGGLGFLGSNLAQKLVNNNDKSDLKAVEELSPEQVLSK